MREASRLCAILDDAAAVGSHSRLRLLADRWIDRALARKVAGHDDVIASLWKHAGLAAGYRAMAVEDRLQGGVRRAMVSEGISESHLGIMARKATRTD